MNALTQYIDLWRDNAAAIDSHAPAILNSRRPAAAERLAGERLPRKGDESFEALSLDEMFAPDYGVNINRVDFPVDVAASFRCGVPNVSTLMAVVVNDTFRPVATLLRNLPEGVIVESLAEACERHHALVEKYLGTVAPEGNAAVDLNTLLLQDGVFIHIGKGIALDRPIQITNIFNAVAPLMAVRRIVVALEDNASAQVLVCDHSREADVAYLANQVVEITLGRGSRMEYFDMEESSPKTSRLSQLFATQDSDSDLTINGTTLQGGVTRNNWTVAFTGRGASLRLAGMAVGAAEQVIDNYTDITHDAENCASNQIFKYVLEDSAVGAFYGRIDVAVGARFTNAYQSNRNLLASENARMYTRPQLEIYCDEVKASHGATVGQLDANALFYMRSRGIPEAEARMMLMQAFMADVIDTVSIPALRTRLQQLIEQRLAGRNALCADCQVSQNQ